MIKSYILLLVVSVFFGLSAEGMGMSVANLVEITHALEENANSSGIEASNDLPLRIRISLNSGEGCDFNDHAVGQIGFIVIDAELGMRRYHFEKGDSIVLRLAPGEYRVIPILENGELFELTPESWEITLVEPTTIDLCINPIEVRTDGQVAIIPIDRAMSGSEVCYRLEVKNVGNTPTVSYLSFAYEEDLMSFESSSITVTSSSDGELNWSIRTLSPFESEEIELCFTLNEATGDHPLSTGDTLVYTADLTLGGDINSSNNTAKLNQVVVDSFEPNDKICLEGELLDINEVGSYLTYLIRFKNVDTAVATHIRITDYIDTTVFDLSTLIPVSASNSFRTEIVENKVDFIFDEINLSSTVGENSGYVQYRIQTLFDLEPGDELLNQAEIYFASNEPIYTNRARTVVAGESIVSVHQLKGPIEVEIFPNPTSNSIRIESDAEIKRLELYSTSGQRLKQLPVSNQVDLSDMPTGVYLLMIDSDKGRALAKVVKE